MSWPLCSKLLNYLPIKYFFPLLHTSIKIYDNPLSIIDTIYLVFRNGFLGQILYYRKLMQLQMGTPRYKNGIYPSSNTIRPLVVKSIEDGRAFLFREVHGNSWSPKHILDCWNNEACSSEDPHAHIMKGPSNKIRFSGWVRNFTDAKYMKAKIPSVF